MDAEKVNAALEDFGWSMLKTHLEAQGHRIQNVRWPDRERKGREGSTQTGVDVEFTQDGRRVGLEIMQLHESPRHGRQRAEMDRLARRLREELGTHVHAVNPHVVVAHWRLHWLPPMRDVEPALAQVKAAILRAAGRLKPGEWEDVVDERPPFALEFDVACYDFGRTEFGFIWSHVEQSFWMEGGADDMAEAIVSSRKSAQLVGYSDARVLGLDRAQMPLTGLLWQALLKRASRIPPNWTAIYFVEPGAAGVVQVWPTHDPLALPPST